MVSFLETDVPFYHLCCIFTCYYYLVSKHSEQ